MVLLLFHGSINIVYTLSYMCLVGPYSLKKCSTSQVASNYTIIVIVIANYICSLADCKIADHVQCVYHSDFRFKMKLARLEIN
jgi:hypothetical protein